MKKEFAVVCFVVAVVGVWNWSPFDYLLEAGSSAYYQARLAYLRGNNADKQAIKQAFSDRMITMHEYSEVVFPAYLRSVHGAEFAFPEKEKMKSKEQLQAELEAILQ
ncbi:hypothetical protein [Janthinobacterium sp. FW305-128]|uniref:hypothetical protein n=1 Tax=Janthinobacterium sp. FW305-128 TaxID=2775055 RepID=UPI001E4EACEF|nr:hypothetical protein [Janthinobacterium sp. FW305-128]MCC7684782.1 hypothetical protein [Janthinobacterium sp. FW305-128]